VIPLTEEKKHPKKKDVVAPNLTYTAGFVIKARGHVSLRREIWLACILSNLSEDLSISHFIVSGTRALIYVTKIYFKIAQLQKE
jgi:hypothetical protein